MMMTETNPVVREEKQTRVLLVDDDPRVLELMGQMLTAGGYQPEIFDSPLKLLPSLTTDDIGCLITDLDMPDLNGSELQSRLLELDSSLAVIVVSGKADVPSTIEVMGKGAVTLIEKPFRAQVLMRAVENALRQSRQRAENRKRVLDARKAISTLNEEELEILKMAARGLPNKAVSHELALSPRTVDRRRQSAFTKLKVNSEAEFALILAASEESY